MTTSCLKRFKHRLTIRKDNETVDIVTEVVKRRDDMISGQKYELEPLKTSNIVMESMRSYLDNVSSEMIKSVVYPTAVDSAGSEQEDETSIQEMITIRDKKNESSELEEIYPHRNYEIHQISADERVDEIADNELLGTSKTSTLRFDFRAPERQASEVVVKPIDGSKLIKEVEKLPDLQDFDQTVEIVDSVVIDHVSEDDKSTSSEEVTYERWTEETKLIKTKVYHEGQLVDEIVQQSQPPELVGNILREKLIERHEHIKHVSKDVLKRVRVKSPGQSRRHSLSLSEILNENVDGSSIIIIEPKTTSAAVVEANKRRNNSLSSTLDNTYYIQHQQVIMPNAGQSEPQTSDEKREKQLSPIIPVSSIATYFGGLEARAIENNPTDVLIIRKDSSSGMLAAAAAAESTEQMYQPKIDVRSSSPPSTSRRLVERRNEQVKSQYEKIILADRLEDFGKSESSVISDSLESMERFERPTKSELKRLHQEKNNNKVEADDDQDDSTIAEEGLRVKDEVDEQKKIDDVTDISDEDEDDDDMRNMFELNDDNELKVDDHEPEHHRHHHNISSYSGTSSSSSSNSSFSSSSSPPRRTPLRRESFELAQKDPSSRRLSVSTNSGSIQKPNLSSTSSSSSISTAHLKLNEQISLTQQANTTNANVTNKRMLSEIKPNTLGNEESPSATEDKSKAQQQQQQTVEVNNDESDSTDTSFSILKRNYDIIMKKTNEKHQKQQHQHHHHQQQQQQPSSLNNSLVDNSLDDLLKENEKPQSMSFVSSRSMNNIATSRESVKAVKQAPPIKPNKIKIVKKQKAAAAAAAAAQQQQSPVEQPAQSTKQPEPLRSVSPGVLRRGPDIIETIETKTSMSFIMNKSVNLVVEEKREYPGGEQQQARLTSAISQPQLYQTKIDDLLSTANSLVKNSSNTVFKSKLRINNSNSRAPDASHSIPIPITVQTRSRSEPKLDQDDETTTRRATFSHNHNVDNVRYRTNDSRFGSNVNNCQPRAYEVNTNQTSSPNRISFHKQQKSNEIIALVNVPNAYETTTVETAAGSTSQQGRIYENHIQISPYQARNFSKSESNLIEKLDSWRKWPEFAVEQDTDTSVISNDVNNATSWVRENQPAHRPPPVHANKQNIELEIEIEKRPSARTTVNIDHTNGPNNRARVSTSRNGRIAIENMPGTPGNEITIRSDFSLPSRHGAQPQLRSTSRFLAEHDTNATRMSSGYFSGEEFRSYNINNTINIGAEFLGNSSNSVCNFVHSPTLSTSTEASNQFNINKFLSNSSSAKHRQNKNEEAAIEDLNRLYRSIALEEESSSSAVHNYSSSLTRLVPETRRLVKGAAASRRAPLPDAIKDDMARRNYYTNKSSFAPSQLDKEINLNYTYLRSLQEDVNTPNRTPNRVYANMAVAEPDIARDDASVWNKTRKRSNSMSSLHHSQNLNQQSAAEPMNPMLILPSPTTADYLRNRTRESALINVVMNPVKTPKDMETSQILYDDMAYRQLRKDSEAHKIAQLKAVNSQYIPNLVNITTLPVNNATRTQANVYNEMSSFGGDPNQRRINNTVDPNAASNSMKTVKMIKQKDATNKNMKHFQRFNQLEQAERYFSNSSNNELNEYYDTLNQFSTSSTYTSNNATGFFQ